MGREYKAGEEPIPGYRLAKFIGRGGFGEVWRAVGPGGTEVALKMIALDRKQGMKEFKSLRLVKRIHHPNLVPILAFWLVDADGVPLDDESIDLLGSNLLDGRQPSTATATMQFNAARAEQLIIAMGLGEKNLLDVLKEYQVKGLAGIPLEELLDYMEGSARAIDFLNTPRHNLGGPQPVAIQHCDIKPQNIMLVGDAVQVCDFGLARSLSDVRSTSVAASIAYGAPELFWENKPTHATDQYSLAITYYELRTGHLPFGPDSAAIEVMQAHRDGKLDLHYLNDSERAVIKRATDPSPSGRFERTIDMVRALQRAAHGGLRAFEGPSRTPSVGMRSSFVQTGREIVPGYTLLEHLFHPDARTDVWSCSAAGGNPQSMWLYEVTSGAVDREALKLIQEIVDQPRLARLSRWWLLGSSGQDITNEAGEAGGPGQTLAIASELTRTNLAHRVEECRQLRGIGIPVDELLAYVQQVAEGIDALNDPTHAQGSRRVSLIHTDLRPANLLVFGNAVKVGNFAWCRTLDGDEAEVAGMPPRTARPTMPPELAAGRIHRRSDQYSLAASYVQMRTGNLLLESGLPTGAASGALAGSSLDMSNLSEAESEVVQRAMHADPRERYPSCRKLAAELALAAKKVPVAAGQPAYPVSRAAPAASVASHTMMPGDLLATRPLASSATPVLGPADTSPDVRKTLEEERALASRRRSRGPALLATAVLVLAAAAAGLFTGKQTETEVDGLIEAGQYKSALEAINSPFWRRWRSDPVALRDRVVSSARDKAVDAAKEGEIRTALDIQAQLKDELKGKERDEFREHIFGKAIEYATENFKQDKYKDAHGIYARLDEIAPDSRPVAELGKNLWQSWAERIAALADSQNFGKAAEIFQQLESPGDDQAAPGDESTIVDVKKKIIAAGIKAMTEAKDQKGTVKALDAAEQFKQVRSFANETGLSQAISELIVQAIGTAQSDLDDQRIDDAKAIHRPLARLDRTNTQVRQLGQQILDSELAKARSRLEENNWAAALAEYGRVRDEWPKEDERAKDTFEQLQGEIVKAGRREFDEVLVGKKPDDLKRAGEICDELAMSFPDNFIVKAMKDDVKSMTAGAAGHAALTPEQLVLRLLNQAEQNIRLRVLEDAAKNLADADEKIDAEFPTRDDLRRRAALDHAYLSWENKDWDDAETWLNQVKAADFAGAEDGRLTQYYLLRALVPARYDGGALPEKADLDALSRAVDELRHSDAKWDESADRLLASGVKELCRELGLQVVGLIGSSDPKQQTLGKLVRDRIDKTYWPENAETLIAVSNTIGLLKSPDAASRDIQKSLDEWDSAHSPIPDALLPRLAEALARWGHESKEPEAAEKAIAWIRSLKQTEDVRRVLVGLAVAQIERAASLPDVDWKQLAARCRNANDDMVAAGAREHGALVRACLAECLSEVALASSSPVPVEAQTEIDAALKLPASPEERPYLDYVTFRISQATGRTIGGKDRTALADSLCEAATSSVPALANPWRQARAAELLSGAAESLVDVDASEDPLLPPSFGDNKQNAEHAYRWLTAAKTLAGAPEKGLGAEASLVLAIAAAEKTEPDHSLANSLLDKLSQGPAPAPKVLLISARSLEKSAPEEAVRRYADALQAALKLGTAANEALYDRIVSPATRVVESLDEKQRAAVGPQAALLYANKGRLIRLDAAVDSKVFEETQTSGADAVFDAYDKAIRLDPNVPDYFIQRGTARYNTTTAHNSLEALKRDDIAPARELLGGKETPGLYGLTGVANLLEARAVQPINRAARLEFYKKAVADAAKAVDDSEAQSEDYPQFLLLHSMACLELANFTTDSDKAIRGYLDSAVGSARKAIADGRGAHPEFAYQALGNAEEDYGLLLKDYDGYRRAVQDFDDARLKALDNLSPTDEALICLGRVRYRLGTCGAEPAAASEVLLASGLADLQAAIDSNRLPPARVAEAWWWQSQIHSARMQVESRKATEQAAASGCLQECLRRVDPASSAWPVYQLYWAGLAGTPEESRRRARDVLDRPNSKADASQRAQALSMIAASYVKPGATAEQIRQQLDQGFTEYQRYLPWLADMGKADDVPALLALSEFILLDRTFWRGKGDLCKSSAQRALALADELQAPELAARARADLGNHALYAATTGQSTVDLAALRKAAEHFKAAVDFDEKLGTEPVTALERQSIRGNLAPNWRYALARVDGSLATDSRTSAADRQTLRNEAIQALDHAKDLPESYKKLYKDYRKKLLEIR
ncbi:MAG TPA: protein kinase [Pirellulales bacterium]|nr:protein kinase [Pirellulales bacterium]